MVTALNRNLRDRRRKGKCRLTQDLGDSTNTILGRQVRPEKSIVRRIRPIMPSVANTHHHFTARHRASLARHCFASLAALAIDARLRDRKVGQGRLRRLRAVHWHRRPADCF
jgi:hypothetical protein